MTISREPSFPTQGFDPAAIPQFSVIRVPYKFPEDLIPLSRLFVVISHAGGFAICIKTTTRTALYKNNPSQMVGCVFYEAGEVPCFPEETVVQPDNQIPIEHDHIQTCHIRKQVEIHKLPSDFPSRLREAVQKSETLTGRERKRIQGLIA
jgi:hypothetical protein